MDRLRCGPNKTKKKLIGYSVNEKQYVVNIYVTILV